MAVATPYALGRKFPSIRAATSALRRNGFKPSFKEGEGPRIWKKVDPELETLIEAHISPQPSGVCHITIEMT